MTSKLAFESSPLVGSSRNRMLGNVISWLAILNRLFWPPLRPLRIGVPTSVSAWSKRPKALINIWMRSLRSRRETELRIQLACIRIRHYGVVPRKRELRSEIQRLANSHRADQGIFLLDVGCHTSERSILKLDTIDVLGTGDTCP